MSLKLFFCLSLILLFNHTYSQSIQQQDLKYAGLNIGANALIGGLGAMVNKQAGENNWKVFKRGFKHGALGGSLIHLGKHLTNQITIKKEISYAWLARITNSAGASVVQNAASNIQFYERWHFNLGIARLDYDTQTKKFRARLSPSMIIGNIIISRSGRLDLKTSLKTGILFYTGDQFSFLSLTAEGLGATNTVGVNARLKASPRWMAHEIMHVLQFDSMIHINPFFNRLDQRWKSKSSVYNALSRFIYFDFNGLELIASSATQYGIPWECRYIEREAEHYSFRAILPTCN